MKIHKFSPFYIYSVLNTVFKGHCNSYKTFLLLCVDSKFTSFTFTIFQASKHFTKTEKFLLLPTL